MDIPNCHSATGTSVAVMPSDTPSSSPERSKRTMQPMQSPTLSQPGSSVPPAHPAGPATKTLWAPTQAPPPAGQPSFVTFPPRSTLPLNPSTGQDPNAEAQLGRGCLPAVMDSEPATLQERAPQQQQCDHGTEVPDGGAGGGSTAGSFWMQLEAMCRTGLQAAALHSQSESHAVLKQLCLSNAVSNSASLMPCSSKCA